MRAGRKPGASYAIALDHQDEERRPWSLLL